MDEQVLSTIEKKKKQRAFSTAAKAEGTTATEKKKREEALALSLSVYHYVLWHLVHDASLYFMPNLLNWYLHRAMWTLCVSVLQFSFYCKCMSIFPSKNRKKLSIVISSYQLSLIPLLEYDCSHDEICTFVYVCSDIFAPYYFLHSQC